MPPFTAQVRNQGRSPAGTGGRSVVDAALIGNSSGMKDEVTIEQGAIMPEAVAAIRSRVPYSIDVGGFSRQVGKSR